MDQILPFTSLTSTRSFRAESLPELWGALPRMKTIALPFDGAEQVISLLSAELLSHLITFSG